MKPGFLHKGAEGSAPESGNLPLDSLLPDSAACREDRACCCPAQPVVRVVIPPTPRRPHSVDLLLCGHHYRVSRPALTAAGARVVSLPGKSDAAEAALLEDDRQHRAEVACPPRSAGS
jgi:hypothetical protein